MPLMELMGFVPGVGTPNDVAVNGLTDSARLICSPIETADIADHSFDIIWGDAVLHHLIDVLEPTFIQLRRCVKPGQDEAEEDVKEAPNGGAHRSEPQRTKS